MIIFYIILYGLIQKVNVYESFITGAADGLKTVVKILPTLVGLMIAVGILRGSGFLEMLGSLPRNLSRRDERDAWNGLLA